jgi:hypothetical protein
MSITRVGGLVLITGTTGRGVWFDAGDAFLCLEIGGTPHKGTIRLAKNGANFAIPFDGAPCGDVIAVVSQAQTWAAAAKLVAHEPPQTLETLRSAFIEEIRERVTKELDERTVPAVAKILDEIAEGRMPEVNPPGSKPKGPGGAKGAGKKK